MIIPLRLLFTIAWLLCLGSTVMAAVAPGISALLPAYVAGFGDPWGAAMSVDFTLYLFFVALWLTWSAETFLRGVFYALLAFAFGGSFVFAYLLVQHSRFRGDLVALLLGRRRSDVVKCRGRAD